MAMSSSKTMLCSLVILMSCIYVTSQSPLDLKEQAAWFRNIANAKQKTATFRFYVHDVISGPNSTIYGVARANITQNSTSTFGLVVVLDDLLTAKPDPSSMEVGRGQGVLTFADLKVPALNTNINYVFTAGKYNGSSICLVGRNQILNPTRELPIAGGTGLFRMARGFSISRTYSFDPVANYGIIEHNVFVSYLE